MSDTNLTDVSLTQFPDLKQGNIPDPKQENIPDPKQEQDNVPDSQHSESGSSKNELGIDILDDNHIIESIGSQIFFRYRNVLKYYGNVLGIAMILSIPICLWIVGFGYLPWTDNLYDYPNYFNVVTVTAVLCIAMVTFGPWYISFYTYILIGKRLFTKKFIVHVVFHTIFWPLFYSILVSQEIYVWYYYLDFAYFFFAFLPLSMHASYAMNNNKKFMIKYALCELFVIFSALGYTFFLYPIFMELSDVSKMIWRLTLHPFWFEFTMVLPQRILTKKEMLFMDEPYKRFLPSLHAIFHNVTIGRMLLFAVNDFWLSLLLIFLTNIEEVIMRLSVFKRDNLIIKWLYGSEDSDLTTHACIVNIEMLYELIGILTSPVFMLVFYKYGYMFIFNAPMTSLFLNFVCQIIMELITDTVCSMFEIYVHKIDLLNTWNNMLNRYFIAFTLYGICTMGILGMLYTTLLLPRGAFCSDHLITTCIYSPI